MEWIPSTHGPITPHDGEKTTRQETLSAMASHDYEFRFGDKGNPLGNQIRDFHTDLLLARVEESFRTAIRGRDNRLRVIRNPGLPLTLRGDDKCLQRALSHAVDSLSRCADGGVIELSTEVQGRESNGVSVTFGISLAEGPTTVVFPEEKGAADLRIANALIQAMGGEVSDPEIEGNGIMIRFSAKFSRPQEDQEDGRPSELEEGGDPDGPGAVPPMADRARRVLLAEDNRVTQAVTRNLLRRRGHEVSVVGNGREAVERVKERPFDVILMDLEMPEMDGLTATQLIRALPSLGPPIVAYTAFARAENRRQCKQAGVDEILAKPVSCEDLFHEVERWPRRIDS